MCSGSAADSRSTPIVDMCMDIVQAPLKRIRALPMVEPEAQIRAVSCQGTINRSFVVEQSSQWLLVKCLFDPVTLPVDRRGQFALQAKAAKQGLAPEPIYLSDEGDMWVEQWCVAQPCNGADDTAVLVSALASLHKLDNIDGVALNLPLAWQTYLSVLPTAQRVSFASAIDEAQAVWQQDHRQYWVCCHHDLNLAHILSAQPPILLDWEYAAMGNRFYDLASCVLVNQLDQQQQLALTTGYAKICDFDYEFVQLQVKRQLPLAKLTSELWYAAIKFNA